MPTVAAFLEKAKSEKTLFSTPPATVKKAVAKTLKKPDHRSRNYEKYSESDVAWKIIAFMSQNGYYVWRQNNAAVFDRAEFVSKVHSFQCLEFDYLLEKSLLMGVSERQIMIEEHKKKWKRTLDSLAANCYKPVPNGIKGVPNLIGFRLSDGKFVGIEIKINKDKMSEHQTAFAQKLETATGIFYLAEGYNPFLTTFYNGQTT